MTTISYSATVNLGNFESERIEITAEITNGDVSPANVIRCLREHVEACTLRPGWEKRARERATADAAKSVRPVAADPFSGMDDT